MQKLTDILDKYNLSGIVLAGLERLSDEEKALDIWETLEEKWRFKVNHKVTSRTGMCRPPRAGFGRRRARPFGEVEVHGLLMEEGREATRNNTLLHEVAHAVNPMLFGTCDHHGPNWKRIMRAFGLVPERCNKDKEVSAQLRAKKTTKAKLMYACQTCEHEFPAMRKKKHPAESYRHRGCRGKLYLKRDRYRNYVNPSKAESYGIAACKA